MAEPRLSEILLYSGCTVVSKGPGNDGKTYLDKTVKLFDKTVRGQRLHIQGESTLGERYAPNRITGSR